MFPPQVPHVFIRWLTEPGDVVYDPFSGRGTAPLEACRLGRVGMGSDANPLAYVLTATKVDPPSDEEARQRLAKLRARCEHVPVHNAPDEIRMLYAPRVLGQLLWLRDHLDITRRDDRFLMGLLLGIMHANYDPGRPARGLSISMPNTFSMSPGYVSRYIEEHGLEPPKVDVFDMLEAKLNRLELPETTAVRGRAWLQDARASAYPLLKNNPAKLIFTSPPYLSVIRYGKYNWVRLWMLKKKPKQVDDALVATGSLPKYVDFMKEFLESVRPSLHDDGHLCLMIGDVREPDSGRTTKLAEHVWEQAAEPLGWKLRDIVVDRLPTQHKVSRIWKKGRGKATKTDRILVLSPGHVRARRLPPLDRIDWAPAADWAREE